VEIGDIAQARINFRAGSVPRANSPAAADARASTRRSLTIPTARGPIAPRPAIPAAAGPGSTKSAMPDERWQ